ncbi:hypothetical protein ACFV4P_03090 [Kitasatospora sp. NPDC059795]|uniref:hypothetical protein n=1 Tax=Kitasatospora sp. NPDC059795 TaxID=3346949 RepID=UPI003668EC8A
MNPNQTGAPNGHRAVLIADDGTTTPVTLPTSDAAPLAIARHLGGPSVLERCTPTCTPDTHFATVGLLERPPAGAPRNDCATVVVEMLRHAPLPSPIHGPALIMGPAGDGDAPTGLEPGQQQAIQDFVAAWRTLLSRTPNR